uniref:Uncharacterized protein n=1 Tax=Romanomermis culicivorax TaxID=13658 RepID=A0A915HHQ9_ROMCU
FSIVAIFAIFGPSNSCLNFKKRWTQDHGLLKRVMDLRLLATTLRKQKEGHPRIWWRQTFIDDLRALGIHIMGRGRDRHIELNPLEDNAAQCAERHRRN